MELTRKEAMFLRRLLGNHVSYPRRDESLYLPLISKLSRFLGMPMTELAEPYKVKLHDDGSHYLEIIE